MVFYPLPQPKVADWGDTIDFWNQQQDRANLQNALATAANPDADTDTKVNALVGVGQFNKAQILKNWQSSADDSDLNEKVGGLIAGGNSKAAENAALTGGNLDLANAVRNRSNAISNQSLIDSNRATEKTASLFGALADSPTQENYDAVKKAGLASGKYTPADLQKADAVVAQLGIGGAAKYYQTQLLGAQAAFQDVQKQREPIINGLARLAADKTVKDEDWQDMASQYASAHGNPDWIKPYLTQQGRTLIKAENPDIFQAQSKATGGRRLAVDFGTQRVLDQFIAQHPEWQGHEKEIEGLAQTAFGNKTDLELGPDGKPRLNLQPGTMAFAKSPEGVAANTRGREATKSNVALEGQLNRLDSVNDQINKVIDYVSDPTRRADAESALGYLTSKSGQEYWRTGQGDNVPRIMFNLRAATHTLQDELLQYMQTKGGASDLRAKNAFEAIGDLPRSPNVDTLIDRLHFISDMTASIRKIRRINPLGEGSLEPPGQAKATAAPAAPAAEKPPVEGARKASDGNWYVPDPNRAGKYLKVE